MNSSRTIGILYLTAIVTYATGSSMATGRQDSYEAWQNMTPDPTPFAAGALLMLVNSLAVVGIGVLTRALLKKTHPLLADFYVMLRVMEAIILCIGIVSLPELIDIRLILSSTKAETGRIYESIGSMLKKTNFYAYQVAMIILGVAGAAMSYAFFQNQWIPRWMSVLGIVGYFGLFIGAILELFGLPYGILLAVPGGLFELIFGIYLIAGRMKTPA